MNAECQLQVSSPTPETTQAIGEAIARSVEEGDVICLHGDLGAGKTTLTQGLARGLGCDSRVTSPTFTLVQEHPGRLRLYHLDCYRLDGPEDLEPLGADDWMGREGVCVIEWPERVSAAIPPDHLDVILDDTEPRRKIQLRGEGSRGRLLLESVSVTLGLTLKQEISR